MLTENPLLEREDADERARAAADGPRQSQREATADRAGRRAPAARAERAAEPELVGGRRRRVELATARGDDEDGDRSFARAPTRRRCATHLLAQLQR